MMENDTRSVVAWNHLPRDVLLIIFKKLGIEDLIIGAPLCCSSWYHASKDSSLWLGSGLILNMVDLPFLGYSYSYTTWDICSKEKFIDSIVARSQGAFTSVKFPLSYFTVDLLHHLAQRCPNLKYLHLEVKRECSCKGDIMNITLDKLCKVITKLRELDGMAIDCTTITRSWMLKILKSISHFCPNFIKLKILGELSQRLAYMISKTLPNLKVVDLSNTRTRREAVLTILNHSNELESLDITGCGIPISNNSAIAHIADLRLKEFNYDSYLFDDEFKEESFKLLDDEFMYDNDLFDLSINRAAWDAVSGATSNKYGNCIYAFTKPAPWGAINVPRARRAINSTSSFWVRSAINASTSPWAWGITRGPTSKWKIDITRGPTSNLLEFEGDNELYAFDIAAPWTPEKPWKPCCSRSEYEEYDREKQLMCY